MLFFRALISVVLLFASALSFAETRVYLLTATPGSGLDTAWGHTAVEVEVLTDSPGRRPMRVVYEYGVVSVDSLLSSVMSTGDFVSVVKAMVDETLPSRRSRLTPAYFNRYFQSRGRVVVRERLNLTPEQAEALSTRLHQEFTAEGGTSYEFKTFTNNCATGMRDHVFAVLPPELRAGLETAPYSPGNRKTLPPGPITFSSLVEEALNFSIATNSTFSVSVVPPTLLEGPIGSLVSMQLSSLAVPVNITEGSQYRTAILNLRNALNDPYSMLSMMLGNASEFAERAGATTRVQPVSREELLAMFDRFIGLLDSQPSAYQAMFSPRILRNTLVELGLIDTAFSSVAEEPQTP